MNKPRQVKTVYYQACTLRRILISLCTFVNRKTCTQSLSAFNYIFDIIAVADHNLRLIKSQQKTGPMSRHDKIITSVSESIYIICIFLFYVNFVLLLCISKDFILRSGSGRQPGSQDSPTCKFYASRSGLTRSGSPTS